MSKKDISDTFVFTVHSWFQSAMRIAGRKVSFPKCSDKTKTYQFRWTKSFIEKCYTDLEIDDKAMKVLVYNLVNYAKSEKILNKGTQILSLPNIIDICYQSLKEMMGDEASLIREVYSCHQFLYDQIEDKDRLVCILQELYNNLPKVVYWYNVGHLTETYLALSKPCVKALNSMPQEYRCDIPNNFELLRICTHVLSDKELVPKLHTIMKDDLRILNHMGVK